MATYAGVDIFGIDYTIHIALNPASEQKDGFFGLRGFERKPGGFRGRVARVAGRLQGIGGAGLAFAESPWYNHFTLQTSAILVDTLGRAWPRMRLVQFEPVDPIQIDTEGFWSRAYRAEFESPL